MSWTLCHGSEDRSGVGAVLSLPDEQPKKAALGDRTGGERAVEPDDLVFCRVVMDVVGYHQGDQHIRVQQRGHS